MSHVASFYCACISLWAGQASGLAERGQAGQMSGERPGRSDVRIEARPVRCQERGHTHQTMCWSTFNIPKVTLT